MIYDEPDDFTYFGVRFRATNEAHNEIIEKLYSNEDYVQFGIIEEVLSRGWWPMNSAVVVDELRRTCDRREALHKKLMLFMQRLVKENR